MKKYSVRIGSHAATTLTSPESVALALLDGMNEKAIRAAFTDLLDLVFDCAMRDPLPPFDAIAAALADEFDSFAVGDCGWIDGAGVERIQ